MSMRFVLPLLLLSAAAPAMAQSQQELTPAAPAPTAAPAPVPAPIVVSGDWKKADAKELAAFIDQIDEEGLDPSDYNAAALRDAVANGDDDALDRVATSTFVKVASDLALGHVRGDGRIDWHLQDDPFGPAEQQAVLTRALSGHAVGDTLRSLLPTHPQYAALKTLLASEPEASLRDKVRLNLDRWRWLPRDLGHKYVIVNVPAYTVAIVEGGQTLNRRRAVAGALKTPTPQLSAVITGAIFNPWWEVPTSLSHEVAGHKGYVSVPSGKGVRWRQPPGPSNALGRVKLVMGNPYAIYLHDTNAKHLFDKQARAYSHGCIRTEEAVGFAETLLEGTEWDHEKIGDTLASKKSVQANLAQPIPVYIVYFTVAATSDGPGHIVYSDMYKRDGAALAALNDLPLPKPAPAVAATTTTAAAKPVARPTAKPAKPRTAVASSTR
ncbi:MAG: L,D-transpeptidase family protein [Alphaproteobacteria bacterium]|nr:L,D-transpeptidase family protein [Alphaproteobacteria bacterium]MBV9371114.1 L,D-transpeptidase family protein [Alphaproteobacteria bacterium]MBV9901512.1 L,D-transpeptidase family protein [Alphaproteobacteria bacterium]